MNTLLKSTKKSSVVFALAALLVLLAGIASSPYKATAHGNGNVGVTATLAPGDLDPTFGTGGTVLTNVVRRAELNDMALQPDGKIVAVGGTRIPNEDEHSRNPNRSFFAVVRYNADGSLDTSFDEDGKLLISFTLAGDGQTAVGVAIQPDGKIIFIGRGAPTRFTSITIFRLNTDGALDTSFNGNGYKILGGSTSSLFPSDVAIQTDGKIVVAGHTSTNVALTRLETDGRFDSSFDGDGIVLTSFGGRSNAVGLAIQPDGQIVVAGRVRYATPDISGDVFDIAVARYNPDGSLDVSFDGDGKLTYDLGVNEQASALAVQPDGKIIIAAGLAQALILVRFNTNGSLDATFDGDGIVQTPGAIPFAVQIQQGGRIVVAGWPNTFGSEYFGSLRYNADGSLDTSFGSNGIVTTRFTDGIYDAATARSMVIQPDGKIIVGGTNESPREFADFALARYQGD